MAENEKAAVEGTVEEVIFAIRKTATPSASSPAGTSL